MPPKCAILWELKELLPGCKSADFVRIVNDLCWSASIVMLESDVLARELFVEVKPTLQTLFPRDWDVVSGVYETILREISPQSA